MQTKIEIEMLNERSVSVKYINYTVIEDIEYVLGKPSRTSYINSLYGRETISREIPEPYLSAILSVWGNEPVVSDEAPPLIGE